jgi:hypothetical protein
MNCAPLMFYSVFTLSFNSFPLIDQDFKIFVLILSFVETRLQSEASVGIWVGAGTGALAVFFLFNFSLGHRRWYCC